jgi:uncharacterized protein (DUF2141 family)
MHRSALLALSLSWAFIALVAFAPLAEATMPIPHQSTVAQLNTGGNIFDQIDSLYNNFTKRLEKINPIAPQQAASPSVKIAAVKTTTGQSAGTPQIIVTLQNGKVALDGVRVDVIYENAAGANVSSDSTVVALKVDETRSVTFTPTGLPAGSYAIGVIVYKNGTDPSNQATPPYDTQKNAATLAIASPTPSSAATGKAGDPGSQTNGAGAVLTQLNTWVYFVIAITALITIALFFVFSQNRSGEDRYEEDHFRRDGYAAGGNGVFDPPASSQSPSADRSHSASDAASGRRSSRRIEVDASESAPEEPGGTWAKNSPSVEDVSQFDADGFVVGDVTSKKALRNKIRGKRGA